MTSADFKRRMDALLDTWCGRRAYGPLRVVLPHYPMPNGFTDEWAELAQPLKTVRVSLGSTLTSSELDALVEVQHAAETAVAKTVDD